MLAVIDDLISEPTETATLTLQPNGTRYNIGASAAATVSITDNDPILVTGLRRTRRLPKPWPEHRLTTALIGSPVPATPPPATRCELFAGRRRHAGIGLHADAGGTTLTENTATIAAGQSYVDVTLAVIDDTVSEPTETATLTLQSGTGYVVGVASSAAISIADNDSVALAVSAVDPDAGEPDNNGTFRITRTGDTTAAVDRRFHGQRNRDAMHRSHAGHSRRGLRIGTSRRHGVDGQLGDDRRRPVFR